MKMRRSVDPGSKGVIWTITVRLLETAIFFSRVCYCLELNETPTSDMGELGNPPGRLRCQGKVWRDRLGIRLTLSTLDMKARKLRHSHMDVVCR